MENNMQYQDKLVQRIQNFKSIAGKQKYKVWNAINPPSIMDYYVVDTPEQAAEVIADLIDDQGCDDDIYSNAFGLEVYDSLYGEWEEWMDDDGDSIDVMVDEIRDERMYEAGDIIEIDSEA